MNVKIILNVKNASTFMFENSKYFKSIADTSVTEFDEIIIVIDTVAKNKEIL